MNEKELIDLHATMGAIFRQINVLPLDELIEDTDRALVIAPYIDPTLYIRKSGDAKRMLRIAKAFKECRDKIRGEFRG